MQGSASLFDEGRFGPVYRSHDPETNQPVLVRTFAQPLSPIEQARLVDALTLLCETPLDHPSIARPLVAGVEDGRPFLVHTLLPGVSLHRFLQTDGPQPFSDVVLRVTQLAAAIDFAAAAGVHHGDVSPHDVIVAPEATGISGFGVVQALRDADLLDEGPAPTRSGDIEALARVAFELLQGRAPESARDAQSLSAAGADTARLQQVFAAALGRDPNLRPASALEFAAALQQAGVDAPPAALRPDDLALARSGAMDAVSTQPDLPLHERARFVEVEPSAPLPTAPSRTDHPLQRDAPLTPARDAAARQPKPVPPPMFSAVGRTEEPRSRPERSAGWFIVAASLAVGLLSGFAAGYVTGLRGDPVPAPQFAADVLRPSAAAEEPSPANPGTGEPPERAAQGGIASTESGVRIDEPEIKSRDLQPGTPTSEGASEPTPPAGSASSTSSPAAAPRVANADSGTATALPRAPAPPASTPAPQTPVTTPRPTTPAPRLAPDTPGGLQVLSRPEGANVFLDGAPVGRTPLVIPSLRPGPYDVRLELAGHRRWVTNVQVVPGERARVAASLEQ